MAERQIADGDGEAGFVEQAVLGAEGASATEESEPIDVAEVEPSRRAKSTVKFPYTDVLDAMGVAQTLKDNFGSQASLDQMAAAMNQKVTSGAFRTKLSAAQLFGAITNTRGELHLTELGRQLTDDRTRKAALVRAFFEVPLYKKLYERYRTQSLPQGPGLDAEIRTLGVVPNQADRARQAFLRSAEHAGLFWGGRDRLVIPSGVSLEDQPLTGQENNLAPPEGQVPVPTRDTAEKERGPLADPMLAGLLRRMLPAEGQEFPAANRQLFFTALAVNLDVIYGLPKDGSVDPRQLAQLYALGTAAPVDPAERSD